MSFKDKIFKNQSPWGSPPSGGGGMPGGNGSGSRQDPPSLDDIIKNFQKTINKFSGGKSGGSRPIVIGLLIILGLYIASGLYRVLPDEQGVVLRFGKFVNTTQPGLHYHLPVPIERVLTPKVTKVNRVDVGFRPASDSGRSSGVGNVPEESLMLTGDENIVDINYSVFWVIKDAGKFLFNIQSPVETVKATSETAMREVIAKNNIQTILTEGRANIEVEVQEITQMILENTSQEFKLHKFKPNKLTHQNKLLMHLEMYRLLEQIEKDQKMRLKLMLTMLFQEREGKQNKFYNKLKLIKKKSWQKQRVKQADF